MKNKITIVSILILMFGFKTYAQEKYRLYVKFKDDIIVPFSPNNNQVFLVNNAYITNYIVSRITSTQSQNNKIYRSFLEVEKKNLDNFKLAIRKLIHCKKKDSPCASPDSIDFIFTNLFDSQILSSYLKDRVCYKQAPNLLNFFTLCLCNLECLLEFKVFLETLETVEYVEIEEIEMKPAKEEQSTNCLAQKFSQHWKEYYMEKLWKKDTSAYGKHAKIIIIESDTKPVAHCEFDNQFSSIYDGNTNKTHATNVYGILKSKHTNCIKGIDCKGLVPDAEIKAHISYVDSDCSSSFSNSFVQTDSVHNLYKVNSLSNALLWAISIAEFGDIVLIPANVRKIGKFPKGASSMILPVESLYSISEIMKIGICRGITFVEAAGNTGNEIQSNFFPNPKGSLGIIVGAISGFTTNRFIGKPTKTGILEQQNNSESLACNCVNGDTNTSFGDYLTCYQMGRNVITTNTNNYYCNFTATSAASTIVAGMLASVQSLAKEKKDRYLSSQELKSLLNSGISVFRKGTNTNKFLPTGTSLLKGISKLRP